MVSLNMAKQINSEGLLEIYYALGRKAKGNVAVKITSVWNGATAVMSLCVPKKLVWATVPMNLL